MTQNTPSTDELWTVKVTELSKNTKMPEHEFWLTIQNKWLIDYSDVVEAQKQAYAEKVRKDFFIWLTDHDITSANPGVVTVPSGELIAYMTELRAKLSKGETDD